MFAHVDTGDSPFFLDDSTLTVRANDGTLIDFNDNFMAPPDSAVLGAVVPQNGSVFYEISGADDKAIASYQLYTSIVDPAAGIVESENNDTSGAADPITTETLITGELSSAADVDFFAVTVPAGGGQILVMLDRDPDDDTAIVAARVGIIDTDGVSALSEDDGSNAVVGGPTSVNSGGTYFVRIRDHGTGTDTDYQFVVQVLQPAGIVNESEPNDDAGTADLLAAGQFGQGTITRSTTSGLLAAVSGGGIHNESGAVLTVTDSVISRSTSLRGGGLHNRGRADLINTSVTDNTAPRGGGLFNERGAVLVIRDGSTVTGNTATGDEANRGGGGIFNSGGGLGVPAGRLAIANGVVISNNTALGSLGSGGGILSVNGVVTIEDSTVTQNMATRAGGGIEMATGIIELRNSHLDFNVALGGGPGAPGNGGGLHVTGFSQQVGHIRVFGGTVDGNFAASEGGGLWNEAGNIMVVRQGAVVTRNRAYGAAADDGGGGIFNNAGRLSIGEGAAITNNRAEGALGSGGGIFTTGSAVSLAGGTLVQGNTAVRAGGGIEIVHGLLTVTDSTIDFNSALGGGAGAPGNGGGIHISGTTGFPRVDVINSQLNSNVAATSGGGLWMQANSVALVRIGSQVRFNWANGPDAGDGGGGGIYNQGGRLVVNNATIDDNRATGALGSGGGIVSVANVTTVENASVSNNRAVRAGGGVEIIGGLFESRNMQMIGNQATGGGAGARGNGGGLHMTGGVGTRVNIFSGLIQGNTAAVQGGGLWHQTGGIMVIADRARVRGNLAGSGNATDGGAGVFNNGGRLAITNSELTNNDATGKGGGILSLGGGVSVDNSTVAHNSATGDGGGIVSNGDLSVNNSTIVQNLADADDVDGGTGGGIFNGGTATLRNTIVSNVSGTAFIPSDIAGNNLSGGSRNTLISHAGSAGGLIDGAGGHIIGIGGTGKRPIESILEPLGYNGGANGILTYALADGSVAIDAGNNFFAKDASGNILTNDQRGFGFRRIEGGIVDMGAFERQVP